MTADQVTVASIGIALLCATPLSACGASAPNIVLDSDACAVAADVTAAMVSGKVDHKVVFSEEDQQLFDPVRSDSDWYRSAISTPAKAPAPPAALIAKLNRTKPESAVKACANVRAYLDKVGVAYGKAAVEKAIDPNRMSDGIYAESILGFSTPVVSDDGADVLLLASGAAAPLGGGGYVQHLRR